jgi:hypothetical protein
MGLEPTPGPWQGPVLPLYYDRPGTRKLYHDTLAATRSYRCPREWHAVHREKRTHGVPNFAPQETLCCVV